MKTKMSPLLHRMKLRMIKKEKRRKRKDLRITGEVVEAATREFLKHGGQIDREPPEIDKKSRIISYRNDNCDNWLVP